MKKLIDVLDDLTDKYIERGTFSRFFEEEFDLSLELVVEENSFEIYIKLVSDGETTLDKEEAEALADKVEVDFFNLVRNAQSPEESNAAHDNFEGKSLFLNGKLLY